MNKELIQEIKKKKVFSGLPDSLVKRVAKISGGDIKESRALLRRYFGFFLTNKVLKGKGNYKDLLKAHMSSRKRDYVELYKEIFSNIKGVGSVVDLGAGLNGFSYSYLKEVVGDVDYLAVEAVGQEVSHMNNYFRENNFSAKAVCEDLFKVDKIKNLLKLQKRDRIVFLFRVVDALETLERDFSKKFISDIFLDCEKIVLTLPTENLGGRKKFIVQRKWIKDFLEDKFVIDKDFEMNGERIIIVHK